MTASISKKRKKRNKWHLFLCVFLGVLTAGGIGLAFLAEQKGKSEAAVYKEQDLKENQLLLAEKIVLDKKEVTDKSEKIQESVEEEEDTSRYGALLKDTALMEQENIHAKEAAEKDSICIAFAGDILFDDDYAIMSKLKQRGGNIETAFSEGLLQEMRGADIFMVNNEFTYTERGEPLPDKTYTFRANPSSVSYLEDMGVDVVSLANNHSYDYGEISLLDTLETLENAGMPYAGAGRNLEEASRAVHFIINDKKISVLAATQIERNDNPDTKGATQNSPGTFRCWNVKNLLEKIEETKAESDYVIVYIHWGTENQETTDWAQNEQAVKIAQAGADIIIGNHPHCLQPVGYVEGIPVIYSMGNFLFNSRGMDTCLVQLKLKEDSEPVVKIMPVRQSDCRAVLLDKAEKARVINYINSISKNAWLDEDGILCSGAKAGQ